MHGTEQEWRVQTINFIDSLNKFEDGDLTDASKQLRNRDFNGNFKQFEGVVG